MSQFVRCDGCGQEVESSYDAGWLTVFRPPAELSLPVAPASDRRHIYNKDFCSTRCAMAFLMQVEALDSTDA